MTEDDTVSTACTSPDSFFFDLVLIIVSYTYASRTW